METLRKRPRKTPKAPKRDLTRLRMPKERLKSDYAFICHGSLWLCRPLNEKARRHLKANIGPQSLWWGGSVVVEPRYVLPLVLALKNDGFNVVRVG